MLNSKQEKISFIELVVINRFQVPVLRLLLQSFRTENKQLGREMRHKSLANETNQTRPNRVVDSHGRTTDPTTLF
jgi:hypothetical protein